MTINKYPILNRNNLIILFFLFLIINYLFFNYRILFRENGYILGDWLVNYNGGFVRRGLLGHFFFYFSKFFNLSIIHIIFIFSSTVYLTSLILFYKIIKKNLSNNYVLIFLFLPSTLLFNFFDPLTVGRKEILVFFFFVVYFLNLENNSLILKIIIFLLSLIFLLTHEIIFFHLPYIFLLKYLHLKKGNTNKIKLKDYSFEILIILCSSLIVSIIFQLSNSYDNILLCSSLSEVGLSTNVCYGTINDLKGVSVFTALWGYFFERNYFLNYFLYIVLTLSPLVIYYLSLENKKFSNQILLLTFFCFLFSLIFILRVNDWGRYLNITFMIQFLIFLKVLGLKLNQKQIKINLNKYLKIILIFLYLFNWHMPHCCNPNLGDGYYDIYNRIQSRIYDETTESTKYKDLPRQYLRKLFNID